MVMMVEEQQIDATGQLRGAYAELRHQGEAAMEAGHLERALALFDESLSIAKQIGDQELIDFANCNRAAVDITLGQYDKHLQNLREILMRAASEADWYSAYNLCRAYVFKRSYKKGLFYAQISRNKATAWSNAENLACSHVEAGRCLVAESRFEEALVEFNKALALLPADELTILRVSALTNLAYPLLVLGHTEEALRMLYTCLRWYRRQGKRVYEAWPHIVLCYAYNELGRLRYAWSHGKRALALAEAVGDYEAIKKSLFLLGNVEKAGGDYRAAYDCYARLRDEFYPEHATLPDSMLVFETRQLVNLRA